MTNKEINKAVRQGEIIVTTKELVKEAVKESIAYLYEDVSDFNNNKYMTARDQEFETLSESTSNDTANEVLDYLLEK